MTTTTTTTATTTSVIKTHKIIRPTFKPKTTQKTFKPKTTQKPVTKSTSAERLVLPVTTKQTVVEKPKPSKAKFTQLVNPNKVWSVLKPVQDWSFFRRLKQENSARTTTTTTTTAEPEATTTWSDERYYDAERDFGATQNKTPTALMCIDGSHRCHELATCHADATSKNGYMCRCIHGYKGNGNIQLHPWWTEIHNETDEAFFEALAEQVAQNETLANELGIEANVNVSEITAGLQKQIVAGLPNSNEAGMLFFNKDDYEFTAGGGARGCVDIDECALALRQKNAHKPPLCAAHEKCANTIGSYECVDSYANFCELGMHDCHFLANCQAADFGIYCKCRDGFISDLGEANGQDPCWDVNECTELGVEMCDPRYFVCANTIGSYLCIQIGELPIMPTAFIPPPTIAPTTIPNNGIYCDKNDPFMIAAAAAAQAEATAQDFYDKQSNKDKDQKRLLGNGNGFDEDSLWLNEKCTYDTCNDNGICVPRTISNSQNSMCICENGATGLHCEIPSSLVVPPTGIDQRYKVEQRSCQDIKIYPGSKGTIELHLTDLYELHCYRFITQPTNAVALSFRFGYQGGCIADKYAEKCLKFQGYWMALDDGMTQLKANRLIQYQSDAFNYVCESDWEPHFLGGHYHVVDSTRSVITWLYQPTLTSVQRDSVRLDYESDIDECSLGIHDCHLEAVCINQIRADNPKGFRCECKDGYYGDGTGCCVNLFYANQMNLILQGKIPPLLARLDFLIDDIRCGGFYSL